MSDAVGVDWVGWSTRFLLFTGKGGVGKTTIAAATAVALADGGRRVLLVSTDPASNLADVLQMATGEQPTPAPGVERLEVMDLDPQAAADAYRARVIGPYRGVIPDSEVAALEEKLAGACTVEVAAFDTFAHLLTDPTSIEGYDHVVFDTAPTGHTLRLLSLPAAWSDYLGASPDATSCLGPLAGLQDDRPVYAAAVAALQDPSLTTVVLAARPEQGALTVAAHAAGELHELGIDHQTLVINGVLAQPLAGDVVAEAYAAAQQTALSTPLPSLRRLPVAVVPLVAADLIGAEALRALVTGASPPDAGHPAAGASAAPRAGGSLAGLVDELERPGRGVVLVTGKGGVGKTTIAHLIAAELARRGHPVHLSTTDPADHAAMAPPSLPSLTTSAIDPADATKQYVQSRLDAATRAGLDQEHLELLAEDLRSPCSEELAVFQAFHQLLGRGRTEYVVIDTAPTGHTLLLLDLTGSFHRQVMRGFDQRAGRIVTPLMRLQDPDYSRILIVTLAETTPVAEAIDLQDDLRRAGIEPYGWIVNATLAGSGTADPILAGRARREQAQLSRVAAVATRAWVVPWTAALGAAHDEAAGSSL